MAERLTREQMSKKYPNTWLGLRNIKYQNDDGVTFESAEVIYTDKTASELGIMALQGEDIQPLFTTPDEVFQLGFLGSNYTCLDKRCKITSKSGSTFL